MGYEIKLYVVDKSDLFVKEETKKAWCSVIAMFDYCKDYDLLDFIRKNGKEATCYFYADDGNTAVLEDCYGKPLIEISLESLVDYFEKHSATTYRRYKPCLALLKSFLDNIEDWGEDLVVLSFGH